MISFFSVGSHMRAVAFWCFAFFLLAGCTRQPLTRTFVSSGTYLEVKSSDPRAAEIVFAEFKRLEKVFDFYSPDSELSRLNRTYAVTVAVSRELLDVLLVAQELADRTQGAFDPSYGALYTRWKECIRGGGKDFPGPEEIARLRSLGGMRSVAIDPNAGTVVIRKAGLLLDLGGIAEGYMVDSAVKKLRAAGVRSALINAGGDIFCFGTNAGKPWIVGIQDSRGSLRGIEPQKLVDAAVTTSGNYEQSFERDGKRYSHLVDPRTGFPVEGAVVSVSVVAGDCVTADSLATAFYIMGPEKTRAFLERYPQGLRVFFLIKDKTGERVETAP